MNGRRAKERRRARDEAKRPRSNAERVLRGLEAWARERGRTLVIGRSFPLGRNRVLMVVRAERTK